MDSAASVLQVALGCFHLRIHKQGCIGYNFTYEK